MISALAFVASIGTFVRGQYIAWQAAQLEFAAEHSEALSIDVAPKRNGWLLEDPTPEFDAASKRNAAGHHRTLAVILAAAGLAAGYWGWAKCRPQLSADDAAGQGV
jgi:uncharacterized protein HemX